MFQVEITVTLSRFSPYGRAGQMALIIVRTPYQTRGSAGEPVAAIEEIRRAAAENIGLPAAGHTGARRAVSMARSAGARWRGRSNPDPRHRDRGSQPGG